MDRTSVVTAYTESHAELAEILSRSISEFNGIDLVEHTSHQISKGEYMCDKWNQSMKIKYDAILLNWSRLSDVFIFCDADSIMLSDITESAEEFRSSCDDIRMMKGDILKMYSPCVFFVKKSNKVKLYLKKIAEAAMRGIEDLVFINNTIKNSNLSHSVLDTKKFMTYRHNDGFDFEIWRGQKFTLPKEIVMFEASWTIGVENKLKLLQYAKETYGK